MTYNEAIRHFGGTQTKLAAALGIKQSAVSLWGRVIPKHYQYQIEVITGGALLVDPDLRVPANSPSPTVRDVA